MQRYGITVPFDGIPLADQRDLFAELPDLGYTDVWSSRSTAPTPSRQSWPVRGRRRCGWAAIAPVFTRGLGHPAQCAPARHGALGRVAIGIGAST